MIMNMQQVMELTGYTRSYIYNLVYKKDDTRPQAYGRKALFVKEEIEQWLMGGRQLTSQELNATADKILLEMGARRTQRRSK